MSGVAIKVEGLSKRYRLNLSAPSRPLGARLSSLLRARGPAPAEDRAVRDLWALRDVSFEVGTGEVLGILGPNGAGKSTLLKVLSRIVKPTAGSARVTGRLGALLEVGTGFHQELTGRENIFLNGAILGMRRHEIAAQLDAIVDFAEIDDFLDTPVKRYSSGMYLRLAFAVAAHVDPDILIIDEVLTVGDVAFQKKCIAKAESFAGTGRTVLVVSHQMSLLQRLCPRSILIKGGRIANDGPTGEVVGSYLGALEALSRTDLRTRTERTGRGEMRVVNIAVSGPRGPVVAGQPADFTIDVEGRRAEAQCVVTIFDDFGDVVTTFDSYDHAPNDRDGEGFVIHVDTLALRPGRYRIDVGLVAGDRENEDHVETAAIFEVLPGLIHDRLLVQGPGTGSVSLAHRWTIRR